MTHGARNGTRMTSAFDDGYGFQAERYRYELIREKRNQEAQRSANASNGAIDSDGR